MRTTAVVILLSALGATLACCAVAQGQDSPAEPAVEDVPAAEAKTQEDTSEEAAAANVASEQPPAVPPWRLTELRSASGPAGPDVFLLPDEAGKLRKVLGFRYEDFLGAWQQAKDSTGNRPPRFAFESVSIDGKVTDATAQLRVELRVVIEAAGWIEIPILMPLLIVQQLQIDDQTAGECLVFDRQRNGYVVWLSGEPGQSRGIVLEGLLKLTQSAGHPGLQLRIPRAAKSALVLHVPERKADFEASPGMIITATDRVDSGSEVRITGHSDPIRLQWKAPDVSDANRVLAIEAVGRQTVRIERHRAVYDVVLEVNSFGKPLDQLRIRLPEGARLTASSTPKDRELVPSAPQLGTHGRIVEIRSPRPQTSPWTLHLSAEQPVEAGEASSCVVGGFEVLGALRQSGTIDLVLDAQLQAYFDLQGDVEQVASDETGSQLPSNTIAASFQYSRFPWELIAQVVPRQRRLSVSPRYDLNFSAEQARLNLSLEYQLAGAKTYALRVDMRGWKLSDDPIESGGLVDQNRLVETRQGLLVLPLVSAEAPRVRLNLTARRDVQLGANTLPLPEPLGAFVTDGLLSVSADPALRLTPKTAASEGLTTISAEDDSLDGNADLPDASPATEREPLQFHTFLARPIFSAETSLRERQIGVDINTRIDVNEQTAEIWQELVYDVKFGPASQLKLRVPERMWRNDSLTIRLDGQEVEYGPDVDLQNDLANFDHGLVDRERTEARQVIVTLPRPLQGTFQLDVRCQLPCPELIVGTPEPLAAPLVAPDDPVTRHHATVLAGRPLRATLNQLAAGETWTLRSMKGQNIDEASDESLAALELQTSESPLILPLMLAVEDSDKLELATLESAWLQSWIAGRRRQDRAVYRFRTAHSRVLVQLPSELTETAVEAVLDGDVVDYQTTDAGQVAVELPTTSDRQRHTLELRYQFPATLRDWAKLRTVPPQLECRSANVPMVWQLILPRYWHVIAEPPGLTGEYWLGWKDYRWGRQPNLSQADLERLTGASTAPPLPYSTNQYLFRAFEIPQGMELTVVRQFWLLSVGVIAAFGVGMILLYTPLAKHGIFWLVVAISLLSIVSSHPEVALLVVQAIFWGGLMTVTAALLRRIFAPPVPREIPPLSGLTPSSTAATTESWPLSPASSLVDPDEATDPVQTGGSVS